MIPRGAHGLLYRPTQKVNRNGDPVDANGNVIRPDSPGTYIGPLLGILVGGPSASPSLARGENADTTGKFGIPTANPYKVQYHDQIVMDDGVTYRITSRPDWDYPNSMSGTPPAYAWVSVEATTDA